MDRMDKYWIESMLGKPEELADLYEHEAHSRLCNALDIADHPAPDAAGKQWVIDQMVRVLLGEYHDSRRYAAWRKFQESHGGWSDGVRGGESTSPPETRLCIRPEAGEIVPDLKDPVSHQELLDSYEKLGKPVVESDYISPYRRAEQLRTVVAGEDIGSPMRLLPAGTMNIIPPMPSQFMRLPDPGESAKQRIGYRVTICHTVYEACDEEWPSGKLLFIREDLVAEWKRTNLPSPNDLPKPDVIVGS